MKIFVITEHSGFGHTSNIAYIREEKGIEFAKEIVEKHYANFLHWEIEPSDAYPDGITTANFDFKQGYVEIVKETIL